MKVGGHPYRTIWPTEDARSVEVIDQTKLPHIFVVARWLTMQDAADGIRTMVVRGAPLIGVAGAYGLALALKDDASDDALTRDHATLLATRPSRPRSGLCRPRNAPTPPGVWPPVWPTKMSNAAGPSEPTARN
jgi:methylthioribose-1-phosphate isomerase